MNKQLREGKATREKEAAAFAAAFKAHNAAISAIKEVIGLMEKLHESISFVQIKSRL